MPLPKRIEVAERELQSLIESHLDTLEEGLRLVDHYVPVGPGIIDTLAMDKEGTPVVIEYKAVADGDEEAIVQAMAYASWMNKNPDAILRFLNEKTTGKLALAVLPDPRIVIVAPTFTNRTIFAADNVESPVSLKKVTVFQHATIGKWPHFETVFDSRTYRRGGVPTAYSIDDHFEGRKARMRPTFDKLASEARKLGNDVQVYAKQGYLGLSRNNGHKRCKSMSGRVQPSTG